MLASHAEPLPSVSQTAVSLSTQWARLKSTAIAIAKGFAQARCGLGGHAMAMRYEKNRVSLQCMSCGHNTPGWTIQTTR